MKNNTDTAAQLINTFFIAPPLLAVKPQVLGSVSLCPALSAAHMQATNKVGTGARLVTAKGIEENYITN
jgi:hypothetical protein